VTAIIGKLSFDRHETLARPVLEQMLDAGTPIGARGVYAAPGIALGWCTDAPAPALDASVASDELHQIRVVADAMLTNADDLRAALERLDHTFVGSSDAELMAHAYQEWGDRAVERFRGAFACAIWDERQRRLLLARDHAGIKPLFFALLHGHGVVFASDTRALLQDPGVGREWCPVAVDAYLALGYVPAPLTVYRRISKLEAAQRLIVDGRRLHVERYWDLPPAERQWTATGAAGERNAADLSIEFERTLRQAIRRDAAGLGIGGTIFSGGIASSALLASSAGRGGDVITAMDGRDATEAAHGMDLARRLDYDVHVEATMTDAAAAARELAARLDEPIADPQALAQFAACLTARTRVTGAFAGHGARTLWTTGAEGGEAAIRRQVRAWTEARDAFDRRAIYTRTFAWEVRDANPFARHVELYESREGADPLERALYVRARTLLPDNRLAIASRAATAAGVALAFPFLDRAALDLAARVPGALKGRDDMRLVRRIVERHVPSGTLPPARSPSPRWLREAVAALVPTLLLSPRFDGRGIVSRPALRQIWNEHVAGERDHAGGFWSLLMLELWLREHIDGDAAEAPLEYAVLQAA
jgi:asparagine synthase (glutamine-hydrolysing)